MAPRGLIQKGMRVDHKVHTKALPPSGLAVNWLAWVVYPSLAMAFTLGLFWYFDVDKRLAYYLSHLPGGFPYAFDPHYEFIFHKFPKLVSGTVYIAMIALALMLIPWLSPLQRRFSGLAGVFSKPVIATPRAWLNAFPRGTTATLWITILAIVFASEMIGHLKRASSVECPIHVQAFGGGEAIPLDNITEPFPSFGEGGQCWPGGHSITGFVFLACFFGFMRMGMGRAAVISLVVAFVYGNFLGLTQVYRGQHYLSHQIWSSYLVWMFSLAWFVFCDLLGKVKSSIPLLFKRSPSSLLESGQAD